MLSSPLAEKQIRDGRQSCEHPQANTLALQLDAYYTAVSLPNVTGVDTTFNRAPQVVFKVHTGTEVFMRPARTRSGDVRVDVDH